MVAERKQTGTFVGEAELAAKNFEGVGRCALANRAKTLRNTSCLPDYWLHPDACFAEPLGFLPLGF